MNEEINFAPALHSTPSSGKLQPWIGVHVGVANALSQEYGKLYGPTVMKVISGGPADLAGIKPKDILLKFDDVRLDTLEDFLKCLQGHSVGDKAAMLVRRNDEKLLLEIEIGTDGFVLESDVDD